MRSKIEAAIRRESGAASVTPRNVAKVATARLSIVDGSNAAAVWATALGEVEGKDLAEMIAYQGVNGAEAARERWAIARVELEALAVG